MLSLFAAPSFSQAGKTMQQTTGQPFVLGEILEKK